MPLLSLIFSFQFCLKTLEIQEGIVRRDAQASAPAKRSQHANATYRNMLGSTCCVRLATGLRRVAICGVLFAQL